MKRLYTVTLLLFTLAATARGQATEKKDSTTMSRDLSEIVVTSEAKAINLPTIGVEKVRIQEMRKVPSLFGERDIIRSLQLLPGVKAESDGSSGFQVRGGKAGQNHILLNDATVYNSGHMMGLFSTFNDAVLAQADLYKSTPPAQFGGGSSSVLNVITKKGGKKFAISGTVGLLSAKLCADIPIGDKVTAFVAARRTYFDLFLKMVKKYRGTVMNFYDINAQVTYTANANNRLNVSFFRGRDNMGMDDLMDSGWDNTLGNVSYRHDFNDAHMMNTSVFLSSYGYDSESDMADVENKYGTAIKHVGLKQSFAWTPSHRLTLNYGFQSKLNDLLSLRIFSQSLDRKEQRRAWENDLWVSADWKPSTRLSVLAGMRLNLFSVLGGAPYYELDSDGNIIKTLNYGKGEIVKTHYTIEPRLSGNLKLNETSSIKAGYAITGQNIRPLYNNGMATVFNRYTMSSNIIKPEVAHQVSVGYAKMLCDDNYELQAEAYYKTIDNVLDYKDGMKFSSEIEAERIILSGRGRSYGLELMGRKRMGKLTGWVSYTLSWTENKIAGINNGKWYTASNDRRHDISIVGI